MAEGDEVPPEEVEEETPAVSADVEDVPDQEPAHEVTEEVAEEVAVEAVVEEEGDV